MNKSKIRRLLQRILGHGWASRFVPYRLQMWALDPYEMPVPEDLEENTSLADYLTAAAQGDWDTVDELAEKRRREGHEEEERRRHRQAITVGVLAIVVAVGLWAISELT